MRSGWTPAEQRNTKSVSTSDATTTSMPWGKLTLFFLFAGIVWLVVVAGRGRTGNTPNTEQQSSALATRLSMQALADTVRPGDVTMYSTTECGYCTQAKSWLNQYGFAFTECNMSNVERCETEFRELGGTGTPFLIVQRGEKTYRMRNGFNSEEFLALMAK